MSDVTSESEPAFHLFLDAEEVSVAALALRLLISDESHQPEIRDLARRVLARLQAGPEQGDVLSLPLSSQEMKITHTAVRLCLNDSQREQDAERKILWRILDKLPNEHSIRAIVLGG
jgi:hypothetical protein